VAVYENADTYVDQDQLGIYTFIAYLRARIEACERWLDRLSPEGPRVSDVIVQLNAFVGRRSWPASTTQALGLIP
jgi:hypothetical protein